MQFSPKKIDFYISALRLILQKRIINNGINYQTLLSIKRIEKIRVMNSFNEIYKTDIGFLVNELSLALTATFAVKGYMIFFHTYGNSFGGLNISAFESLLCEITRFLSEEKGKGRVKINIFKEYIEITADQIIVSSYINRLIKILKGTVITVPKLERYGIKIPIVKAKESYLFLPSADEYIQNPFSSVNLAVNTVKALHDN